MYNIAGFILSMFFVSLALGHLEVDSNFYLDEVAIFIVFGGTLGTLIISFPPIFLKKFFWFLSGICG